MALSNMAIMLNVHTPLNTLKSVLSNSWPAAAPAENLGSIPIRAVASIGKGQFPPQDFSAALQMVLPDHSSSLAMSNCLSRLLLCQYHSSDTLCRSASLYSSSSRRFILSFYQASMYVV